MHKWNNALSQEPSSNQKGAPSRSAFLLNVQ
ncbi:hypothetical protein GA0116948_105208 [Chitinophaga costaii]|uniref:Uncharacterized protein n=1 Tax=Chitinophaga costaii TaxID=1335309 RepID=A0A1C4DD63_9BACT|nr:hypothetical protein GA0116948_105208 [Chitinophaga costaii]